MRWALGPEPRSRVQDPQLGWTCGPCPNMAIGGPRLEVDYDSGDLVFISTASRRHGRVAQAVEEEMQRR